MLKLYIGNKNYSSWSLRPWLMLKQAGIAFEEILLRFDDMAESSPFKQQILKVNPTGTVPVLVEGDLVVWDTLAIAEYAAETFPQAQLWPGNKAARARARSVCAEMHTGFGAVRQNFPMNLEAKLPHIGQIVMRDNPAARAQLARIDSLWCGLLAEHGGPMLFGDFGIADAYFAPVCTRIQTYGLPVSDTARAYVERVRNLSAMRAWTDAALQENDFVVIDEPYRAKP